MAQVACLLSAASAPVQPIQQSLVRPHGFFLGVSVGVSGRLRQVTVPPLRIRSASYGIPDYGIIKTPKAPGETKEEPKPEEPQRFWEYGAPKPYGSPATYTVPKGLSAPFAYSPSTSISTETTDQKLLDSPPEPALLEPVPEPILLPPIDYSGGDGSGGHAGGSGGGGGGGGGDEGSSNDGGADKGKDGSKKLTMSQLLTMIYAGIIFLGGFMGFMKSGSIKSLVAGSVSAAFLFAVVQLLPSQPLAGSLLGLGVSGALLAVMGQRFLNSGRFFPAGFVSLISFIMGGGYIHGIARSGHK